MQIEMTLPPIEKLIAGDKTYSAINLYGSQCGLNDFAVWNYGVLSSSRKTNDGRCAGYIWSSSDDSDGDVRAVNQYGDEYWDNHHKRELGARPALPKSVIQSIWPDAIRPGRVIYGLQSVTFAKYLTDVENKSQIDKLENLFQQNKLTKFDAGLDARIIDTEYSSFTSDSMFLSDGEMYIRKIANPYDDDSVTADGRAIKDGDVGYFTPKPVEFFDTGDDDLLSVYGMTANVPFNNKRYDGNFHNTVMYRFLNNVLLPQMLMFANLRMDAENPRDVATHNKNVSHNIYVLMLAMRELDKIRESGAATDAEIAAEFARAVGKGGIPPFVEKLLGMKIK